MKIKMLWAGLLLAVTVGAGEFRAGFGRADITPDLGTPLAGYYSYRPSDGVLDPLEASCVAVSDGTRTALLISIDHLQLSNWHFDRAREAAAKAANLPPEAVYIAATHTHLAPVTGLPSYCRKFPEAERKRVQGLIDLANRRIIDGIAKAGADAVADLAPANIRLARTTCPDIAFIRRYRMKDGSTRTNPGTSNPNIDHPIGKPDETVQVVRLERIGKPDIAIINFQTHPDTIGGTKCSADWPGFTRRILERALDHAAYAVVFNGAQGDTNHSWYPANLLPRPKVKYDNARRIGQRLAGAVLGVWEFSLPAEAGDVHFKMDKVHIPARTVDPTKVEHYQRIRDLHFQGRREELVKLCGPGMEVTTAVAEALNCLDLHKRQITAYDMRVSCVAVGKTLAFGGFPGEPFTELGRFVKRTSKFRMTIPTCCTNGSYGYLPEHSAFAEGGYEQRSSRYAAGVGEKLAQGLCAILEEFSKQQSLSSNPRAGM